MDAWWTSLELFQKVMWCIAIPSSVIFVIQMVMTFVGMDADGGLEGDMGGADVEAGETPFQLFTFRNLINFFLGFSWTGISFYNAIENKFWLVVLATFMGVLLVAIVMLMFYLLSKTTQSGNIDIKDTVGLTATVYFPVPANRERAGKIQVSVKGAIREYDAMTAGDALKTGELVKIVNVIEGNILLVEKVL